MSPGQPEGRGGTVRDPAADLPTVDRVLLLVLGWLLVLLGVAGLVLPILQGVLLMLVGGAVLSLVSEAAFQIVRRLFRRWPRGWRRLLGWRRWAVEHHKTLRWVAGALLVVIPLVTIALVKAG